MATFKKLAGAPPSDDTDDPIAQSFRNIGAPAPPSADYTANANRTAPKPGGMPTRKPNETLEDYAARIAGGG